MERLHLFKLSELGLGDRKPACGIENEHFGTFNFADVSCKECNRAAVKDFQNWIEIFHLKKEQYGL